MLRKIPLGGARYPFPIKQLPLRTTGDLVCVTYWNNRTSCDGVTLDVDSYDYGPETVTWGDAANDPYSYNILVNDYDDEGDNWDNDDVEGLGPSGAKVTLFGETNIKMEAEAGNSGRQSIQIFVKLFNYSVKSTPQQQ